MTHCGDRLGRDGTASLLLALTLCLGGCTLIVEGQIHAHDSSVQPGEDLAGANGDLAMPADGAAPDDLAQAGFDVTGPADDATVDQVLPADVALTGDLAVPSDFSVMDSPPPDLKDVIDAVLADAAVTEDALPDLKVVPDLLVVPDLKSLPDLKLLPDLSALPTITSVSPGSGPTTGGTVVTIKGTQFLAGAKVTFDGAMATNVKISQTQITADTPANLGKFGPATVTVTNIDGGSMTRGDLFSYYAGTLSFADTGKHPGAGNGPTAIVIADFDGDKALDVATSNKNSGDVSVFLAINNATGSFANATTYGAHLTPSDISVADVNKDMIPDILVANYDSDDVSVLLGQGMGVFGAAKNTVVGMGAGPVDVVAAEFYNDGKPAIATADYPDDEVGVLRSDGMGGFMPDGSYGAGSRPVALAVADFNGDNKPDVAMVNNKSGTVTVLLNACCGGGKVFATGFPLSVDASPYAIATADLNGDKNADLVVANRLDDLKKGTVSVLLGDGKGKFKGAMSYPVGVSPKSVTLADFDGDGAIDIATANYLDNTVSVLLNKGDGTFKPGMTFPAGMTPLGIVSGDLNKDGLADIVVVSFSNAALTILLNTSK